LNYKYYSHIGEEKETMSNVKNYRIFRMGIVAVAFLLVLSACGAAQTGSGDTESTEAEQVVETAAELEQAQADQKAAEEAAAQAEAEVAAAKAEEEAAKAAETAAIADAQKAAEEKAAAEKLLAEAKSEEEKQAAQKVLAEKAVADKAAADALAQAAAAKAAAEKTAAAKVAAEKAAADKVTAEKAAAQKAAANNAAAEKLAAEIVATEKASKSNVYPNAKLLVEPDWLEKNLKNVIILDTRSTGYEKGFIPGAVNLKTSTINDPKNQIDGFLLGPEGFSDVIRKAGVFQNSTVVIYDAGNSLNAARLFYALEYYGLQDKVKILNGGYTGWLVAGKAISTEVPKITAGNFEAKPNKDLFSTKDDVKSNIKNTNVVFLDTRSANEYLGKDVRAKNGGRIPTAVNREWSESIQTGSDGVPRFKPYQQLREEFAKVGAVEGKTVVPYCQTNVRGAHTYFTLRLLGYSNIRPYEGSWAEWGNAEDVEFEK
jgi:thiosulfate/3-mercaptopyruvate sulfurtransferase